MIYIIGLIIIILYLFWKPTTFELFEINNKSVTAPHIFKENHDLNYIKHRSSLDISKKQNINTQQIPPINNPSNGKDKYPKTINAQDLLPSSRIPDDLSNSKNLDFDIDKPNFGYSFDRSVI